MIQTKFTTGTALGLAASLAGIVTILAGVLTADAADPAKAPNDLSWIDQRVDEWSLTKEERRFDEIGWAENLPEAQRLAREQNRPLFVFTYSGSATEANAIALRRC